MLTFKMEQNKMAISPLNKVKQIPQTTPEEHQKSRSSPILNVFNSIFSRVQKNMPHPLSQRQVSPEHGSLKELKDKKNKLKPHVNPQKYLSRAREKLHHSPEFQTYKEDLRFQEYTEKHVDILIQDHKNTRLLLRNEARILKLTNQLKAMQ